MLSVEDVFFRDTERKPAWVRNLQSVWENTNDNVVGYCIAFVGDGINEKFSKEFGIIVTDLFPEQPVGEFVRLCEFDGFTLNIKQKILGAQCQVSPFFLSNLLLIGIENDVLNSQGVAYSRSLPGCTYPKNTEIS